MQKNLDMLIWSAKHEKGEFALTEKQKADILAFIGKRCRAKTVQKLERRLSLPLSLWERYGIYSRIILDDDGASYICGQSWPDEMRTLRECVLK